MALSGLPSASSGASISWNSGCTCLALELAVGLHGLNQRGELFVVGSVISTEKLLQRQLQGLEDGGIRRRTNLLPGGRDCTASRRRPFEHVRRHLHAAH